MLVSLTEEGIRMANRLTHLMADVQDVVFGRLTTKERSALMELLGRVGT